MYIKRKIEDQILKYLHTPEILAIVGPRQCGKTTTLKQVYQNLPNAVFLNFEDQETLSMFENNIKQFAQTYVVGKKYVIIDEFQYARNGGKLLKYLYDMHKTKIIISGSSIIDLTVKAIKFLVGRIFVFNMFPFDFFEFLLYRDSNFAGLYKKMKINLKKRATQNLGKEQMDIFRNYYEEYVIWGGYPRVILAKSRDEKIEVLKNIYNTYFLRDVKSVLGLIDDYKLGKLIKALSLQIGNMVEYNELAQISELSFLTIKKYLNFLSKTYINELIKPFYQNKRKEIVKNQKIYFYDTGLRNFIVNDFRYLNERLDSGSLLENSFWVQLIKNGNNAQYWRDKNKNEVDFIINLGENKTAAFEIKYHQKKCKKFPAAFIKEYKNIITYCVYLKSDKAEIIKNQLFLPLF